MVASVVVGPGILCFWQKFARATSAMVLTNAAALMAPSRPGVPIGRRRLWLTSFSRIGGGPLHASKNSLARTHRFRYKTRITKSTHKACLLGRNGFMSKLEPTQDAASLDENAIADAVALLSVAAQRNFAIVEARLKAAGFVGITGYEPIQATPNIDTSIAADIGAAVKGRGIYHGAWQPSPNGVIVHAYSDMDLLRDASG